MKNLNSNPKNRQRALVFVLFGLLTANTSLLDFSRFSQLGADNSIQTVHFSSSSSATFQDRLQDAILDENKRGPIDLDSNRVGDLPFHTRVVVSEKTETDSSLTLEQLREQGPQKKKVTYVETMVEAGCHASRCLSRRSSIRVDPTKGIADIANEILASIAEDARELAKESEEQKKEEERQKRLAELHRELKDKQERCEHSSAAEVDEERMRIKPGRWEPGERLECRKDYISSLDRKEAEEYFHKYLKGDLSDLLVSDDPEERRMGHMLMRDLSRSSQLRRVASVQFSFQNIRQAAMWNQQIGPLQRAAATGDQWAQIRLEMIQNQIRAQYGMSTHSLRHQLTWMDPANPHYERMALMLSDLEHWESYFAGQHIPALGSQQDLLAGFQGDSLHSIIMNPALPERLDLGGRVARVGNPNLGIMNQNSQWSGLRRYNPASSFNQVGQQPYFSGQVPPSGLGPAGSGQPAMAGQRTMPERFRM